MISTAELMELLQTRSCGAIEVNGIQRQLAWSAVGPEDVEVWFFNPSRLSTNIISFVFTKEEICLLIRNKYVKNNYFSAQLAFSRW